MTRRLFLAMGGAGLTTGCASAPIAVSESSVLGRLRARPKDTPPAQRASPGWQPLGLGSGRDGSVYVPSNLPSKAPLVVLLHGAGGSAQRLTSRLDAAGLADRFHAVILAPDSRDRTWDAIGGRFGPDVAFVDAALTQMAERVSLDETRMAIGGFSDGASYALSLGLINGDLFTHVMAFSPGFLVADQTRGKPAIFISHGTHDGILPIDRTSRRLVPALKKAGYQVDYREFDGPHTVPANMAEAAFEWMNGGGAHNRP